MSGDGITGRVLGAEKVQFQFETFSVQAARKVGIAVEQQGIELQNTVRSHYLSGGSLNKRTGRLINSINTQFSGDGKTFTSIVGTKVPYGRFWELGFHGVEQVRSYVRSVPSRNMIGIREDLKSRKGTIAKGIAFVRAHDRNVNQAARPFLQPALAERAPDIRAALQAAVFGSL